MFFPPLIIFLSVIFLICCAVQITAAGLLFPDKGAGPKLLFVGTSISLIGVFSIWIFPYQILSLDGSPYNYIVSAIFMLGTLMSCMGMLLHARQRQRQGNRVAELEAMIASIQKS